MTDFGSKRDAEATLTCTLTSLASGSARESDNIDVSASIAVDVIVSFRSKGTAGSTGFVDVYVYTKHGSVYTDGATGADAAFTAANRKNSRLLGSHQLNGTGDTPGVRWSIAEAFGGVLPDDFGLIVINNSGGALSSTAGDHEIKYRTIYGTTL